MSEYQYYEFLAIERPLSSEDMRWLRSLSTRAQITPTSFVNTYQWGNFKGDPAELIERCFDAHVYVSNFGYCRFMLKLPADCLDARTTRAYAEHCGLAVTLADANTLLDFSWEDEPDSWDMEDDGSGWMASLAPLRNELLQGDHRALYLAWLLNVQYQALDDTTREPPTPPGLQSLSAPDGALANFLRVDPLLISVAAERSTPLPPFESSAKAIRDHVRELAPARRDDLLRRLLLGDEPQLRHKTLRRIHGVKSRGPAGCDFVAAPARRTVGELFTEWDQRARAERRRATGQAAREQARRAEEEARARQEYLSRLAARGSHAWDEVAALIQTRAAANYDRAVDLLKDLRDVAAHRNGHGEFAVRLRALREHHARKPALVRRINEKLG